MGGHPQSVAVARTRYEQARSQDDVQSGYQKGVDPLSKVFLFHGGVRDVCFAPPITYLRLLRQQQQRSCHPLQPLKASQVLMLSGVLRRSLLLSMNHMTARSQISEAVLGGEQATDAISLAWRRVSGNDLRRRSHPPVYVTEVHGAARISNGHS